jgi:hypothetical protein
MAHLRSGTPLPRPAQSAYVSTAVRPGRERPAYVPTVSLSWETT